MKPGVKRSELRVRGLCTSKEPLKGATECKVVVQARVSVTPAGVRIFGDWALPGARCARSGLYSVAPPALLVRRVNARERGARGYSRWFN